MISELDNVIQPYAWGSREALAALRGHGPTAAPEAELWMGAHPLAPSRLRPNGRPLDLEIAEAPETQLGAQVAADFEGKLPFLLKVLAAAAPLSLQAHPTREQADQGFAADEAQGIPLAAPHRNYKDRNHKPELLCALGEFWALCGFRNVRATLELLGSLNVPALAPCLALLESEPNQAGIARVFAGLMQAPAAEQRTLAAACARACQTGAGRGPFARELEWGARIAALYPGDVGLVSALLLNLVRLEAGEAIYLPAGNLHAYLGGTGVEIMASSDNVLRGGLTPKHVNVSELLRVLDFRPLEVEVLRPVAEGIERRYITPAREFELSWLELANAPQRLHVGGPEIWLAISGTIELGAGEQRLRIAPTESVFVPASTGELVISGRGRVFRAKVPHPG
jgi:mannose-6-phosphate isomerase